MKQTKNTPKGVTAATAAEIMTARIYLEFEDWSTTVKAEINPYTESISIFKEA